MTKEALREFIERNSLAVLATVAPGGGPQSALVGIAVSPRLEIIFDTLTTTRKYRNLLADPRASFVIGWEDEITLQYEGIAEELRNSADGGEHQELREIYFAKWPDGLHWKNITHFAVRPKWLRYSDFNPGGNIVELRF